MLSRLERLSQHGAEHGHRVTQGFRFRIRPGLEFALKPGQDILQTDQELAANGGAEVRK
jgi:hypothetical protein